MYDAIVVRAHVQRYEHTEAIAAIARMWYGAQAVAGRLDHRYIAVAAATLLVARAQRVRNLF